jgi:hypothetical protein
MDLEQALQVLHSISPMPDVDVAVDEIDAERIDLYDDLIEEIGALISEHADARIIKILANSFGLADGFGVFWGTLHLIERFGDDPDTYAVVQSCAKEGTPGVQEWCCFILGRRRDIADLPIFLALLQAPNSAVIVSALRSIEMLAQKHALPEAVAPVEAVLKTHQLDSEIVDAANDALQVIRA